MEDALRDLCDDRMDFDDFCRHLEVISGITIAPEKSYLVSARIRQIMSDNQFSSLGELMKRLKAYDRKLTQAVVDAMTTNETFWFRDGHPFHHFTNHLLPHWNQDPGFNKQSIRVWSAACSSGQEPFSLAILAEEYKARFAGSKRVDILATDLSSRVLEQAKSGVYDTLSIGRGLSPERLDRFFDVQCEKTWRIKSAIANYVQFKALNLLDNFTSLGKFDIVFCRNVLIYFAPETKADILKRLHATINPGGYLYLGSSEGLGEASSLFTMIKCNPGLIYQAK